MQGDRLMGGTDLLVRFIGLDLISRVAERAGNSVDRMENRIKRSGMMSSQSFIAAGIAATTFGVSMLAAAGAATAGAVHMVEVAAEFSSQMTLLHTHANVATTDIATLTDFIMKLAPAVGFGPTELAKAMYRVESVMSSLPKPLRNVATAEDLLTQGAKLAAIGHSDLEKTVKAVGNAFVVYSKDGLTASQITAVMNNAIGEGDMRMQDWVQGMATGVLPVAQQAGIRFQSLGAAIATLTDAGIPATRASTYLRSAIIQMTMPSNAAIDALKSIGLAEGEAGQRTKDFSALLEKAGINQSLVAEKLRSSGSFAETLKFLQERLVKAGATAAEAGALINRSFGGIRSGTGVVTLFNNIVGLQKKEEDLNASTNTLDKTWQYFNAHDPAFAMKQLHAASDALQITIGNALLPYFLRLVNVIGPVIQAVIGWANAHKDLVAKLVIGFIVFTALAGIILLIVGFALILAGTLGVLIGWFGAIGGAIIPIIAIGGALAVIFLFLHSRADVLNKVIAVAKMVWQALVNAFNQIKNSVPHKELMELEKAALMLGKVISAYVLPILGVMLVANLIILGGLFKALVTMLSIVIPAAIQIAIGVFQVLGGIIVLATAWIIYIVKIANDLIHGNWKQAWKDAQEFVHVMADAVQNIVKGLVNIIEGLFKALYGVTIGIVVGFVEGIVGAFKNLFHILVGGSIVPDMINAIVDWFWQLPGRVASAVWNAVGQVVGAFNNMVAQGVNVVNNFVGAMANAGYNLALGIARGIANGAGAIANAARNAASSALNAAKNFLGISSPSKVMADQVGLPVAQGVAIGIMGGRAAVHSSLAGLFAGAQTPGVRLGSVGLAGQLTSTSYVSTNQPSRVYTTGSGAKDATSGNSMMGNWDSKPTTDRLDDIKDLLAQIGDYLQHIAHDTGAPMAMAHRVA